MRVFVAALSTALLVPSFGGAARAAPADDDGLLEPPRARQGYFVGLGLHALGTYARESGDGVGPMAGTAASFRVGQLLTPRLGLGLALDLGGGQGDGDSVSSGALSLVGQGELAERLTLHAGVGLSLTTLAAETNDDDAPLRGVYGAAFTAGLTWDWFWTDRRSGGWALSPGVQLRAVPGDTDAYSVMAGLEVTWWSGLPRHQLELGVAEAYAD